MSGSFFAAFIASFCVVFVTHLPSTAIMVPNGRHGRFGRIRNAGQVQRGKAAERLSKPLLISLQGKLNS
jgi:hypothetical protein